MGDRHRPLIDAAAMLASGTPDRATALAPVRTVPTGNGIALRPPASNEREHRP
jgi:hypothetical protein